MNRLTILAFASIGLAPLHSAPKRRVKPPVFYANDDEDFDSIAAARDSGIIPPPPPAELQPKPVIRYTVQELLALRASGALFIPIFPEQVYRLKIAKRSPQ